MRTAFAAHVRRGGGFVSYHAANNAFPEWPEYNEMIGIGDGAVAAKSRVPTFGDEDRGGSKIALPAREEAMARSTSS